MVLTPSTMLDLGSVAPDFSLPDVISGETVSKADFADKPLLVMFISAHCPFVIHLEEQLAAVANEFADRVAVVAISANDVESYPDDAPEKLKAQAQRLGFNFAYLYDESQEIAKAYTAACTPDLFLFDSSHALYYRGQFDASRPGNDVEITGSDLHSALTNLVSGGEAPSDQQPSIGCNIKWKAGNEPDYFG